MPGYSIHGTVSEGFETVQDKFEQNFIRGVERNAQLCVYVGDNKVVDLWGTTVEDASIFNGDSLCTVFSSTKSLAAICMATLVDKKLLSYSDKVVKHWPEYGNGDEDKELMTVAQILRHEGGMAKFSNTLMLTDIQRENIKQNSIGSIIEKEPLLFPPAEANTKAEYHALTRGWILNEIFRRIDPDHRTMGECLRQDISSPLNADAYIGLESEELSKSFNLSALSKSQVIRESMKCQCLGRKVEPNFIELLKIAKIMKLKKGVPPLEHFTRKDTVADIISKYDYSVIKTGEMPSANGQCSARGLARIAAMMANKGKVDGIRVLSEETWNTVHSDFVNKMLYPFKMSVNFSQGGVNRFIPALEDTMPFMKASIDNRQGYIGWMGLGGSVFQWYPEYKIGFGYVPTLAAWEDLHNARASILQKEVLDCVKIMRDIEN